MTASDDRTALKRLNDALAEDILDASDETILAEARQDGQDPERIAAATRELFEKAVLQTSKIRLVSAQAAVAAARLACSRSVVSADPQAARRRLQRLLTRHPDAARKLTLAARKGESAELSDEEVRGLLEDFEELGIADTDPEC
jgi:hypothetical protein